MTPMETPSNNHKELCIYSVITVAQQCWKVLRSPPIKSNTAVTITSTGIASTAAIANRLKRRARCITGVTSDYLKVKNVLNASQRGSLNGQRRRYSHPNSAFRGHPFQTHPNSS